MNPGEGQSDRLKTRRELFGWVVRGGAVAALAALSARMAGAFSGGAAASCGRQAVCRGCELAQDCVLPQAMSYREVQADGRAAGGKDKQEI